MKSIKSTILKILFFGLLATAAGLLYRSILFIIELYSGLDEPTKTLFMTAGVLVLFIAVMIAGAIRTHGRHLRTRRLYDEKLAAYGKLISMCRELSNANQSAHESEEQEALRQVENRIVLAANPKVLRQYDRLKKLQCDIGWKSQETERQIERLILEIRRDIGYGDWAYKDCSIFNIFFQKVADKNKYFTSSKDARTNLQMPSS